jgi:hypothetical protein
LFGLAYEEQIESDALEDDDKPAIEHLRRRLEVRDTHKFGIVLVTGPNEHSYSQFTIPIWRAYCEHHKLGFFLQEERLNTDLSFDWAKPRVLMELLPKTKWRYLMMVDANSLPNDFNRSWEGVVKEHMRYKRYKNDEPDKRLVFCPWDCEKEYDSPYSDGSCYGPVLSGCVWWSKKPRAVKLARSWYVKRSLGLSVLKTFEKMKGRNWDEVFYKDVQKEIGRRDSSFIATFEHDESYGWNTRDMIYDYIKNHTILGAIANVQHKKEAEL